MEIKKERKGGRKKREKGEKEIIYVVWITPPHFPVLT